MTLKEKLIDFSSSLVGATNYPPNDYPEWGFWTYETHMADLKELWATIRTLLKKDADKISLIDQRLHEAISAFDAGDKEAGVKAILDIYNLEVRDFR
ncbi:MAG: hypothetical protein V4857_06590 [Pseudomonadota bacterium]